MTRVIKPTDLVIQLEAGDLRKANALEISRNDKPPTINKKFDTTQSDFTIHYIAALAEVAWEKHTGWEVDKEQKDGDNGIDFRNDGRTYQLKTRNVTSFCNPDLLCRIDYDKADRYILSEIDLEKPTEVVFTGWCSRDELIQEKLDVGHGERYVRYRSLLRQMPQGVI